MGKVIIGKLSKQEFNEREIYGWPKWSKVVSRFDYTDAATEECDKVKGEIVIETDKKTYQNEVGDFLSFRKDLKCARDINSTVRKHYIFQ